MAHMWYHPGCSCTFTRGKPTTLRLTATNSGTSKELWCCVQWLCSNSSYRKWPLGLHKLTGLYHGQKFRTFEPAFHVRSYRLNPGTIAEISQEMLLIIQSFGRPIQLYNKTNEDREEIFGWKNHRTFLFVFFFYLRFTFLNSRFTFLFAFCFLCLRFIFLFLFCLFICVFNFTFHCFHSFLNLCFPFLICVFFFLICVFFFVCVWPFWATVVFC